MIDKSLKQHYEVTAPRKKKVKGQLHKLAYITDKEAKLLQKFGGQKVMTPEKIPAYPPPGERGGAGYTGSSSSSSSSSGGGGSGGPPNRNFVSSPPPTKARAPTVSDRVSPGQSMAMVGNTSLAGKTQAQAETAVSQGEGKVDVGFQEALRKQNIKKPIVDAREDYISKQYMEPRNIYEGTDLEGQKEIDDIRAKRRIQFDPNLSKKTRKDLNLYNALGLTKNQFMPEPKKSTGRRIFEGLLSLYTMGQSDAAKTVGRLNTARKAKQYSDDLGITKMISDKFNLSDRPTKDRIIKQSIATGSDGTGAQQVVSEGKDVVTQKIKEFTGAKPEEKVTQQPTDAQRSQLLLILKQLQKYNNENRLNKQGQSLLTRLNSLLFQRTTGGSKFI